MLGCGKRESILSKLAEILEAIKIMKGGKRTNREVLNNYLLGKVMLSGIVEEIWWLF